MCDDVNNCNYDLTGAFLRRTYGSVAPRVAAHESFVWFRQDPYLTPGRWTNATVLEWAFAYVPTRCKAQASQGCRVHVTYHPCLDDQWGKCARMCRMARAP